MNRRRSWIGYVVVVYIAISLGMFNGCSDDDSAPPPAQNGLNI